MTYFRKRTLLGLLTALCLGATMVLGPSESFANHQNPQIQKLITEAGKELNKAQKCQKEMWAAESEEEAQKAKKCLQAAMKRWSEILKKIDEILNGLGNKIMHEHR